MDAALMCVSMHEMLADQCFSLLWYALYGSWAMLPCASASGTALLTEAKTAAELLAGKEVYLDLVIHLAAQQLY